MNTPTAVYGRGCESKAVLRNPPSSYGTRFLMSCCRHTSDLIRPGIEHRTWHARPRDPKETYIGRTICCASNAGTGRGSPAGVGGQDANAVDRGSEAVVVVGVTSHRGARESRAQGEGPQNSTFQLIPRQAAVGRITKATREEVPYE